MLPGPARFFSLVASYLFFQQFKIDLGLEELLNGLLGIADIVHVEQLHGRVGIRSGMPKSLYFQWFYVEP